MQVLVRMGPHSYLRRVLSALARGTSPALLLRPLEEEDKLVVLKLHNPLLPRRHEEQLGEEEEDLHRRPMRIAAAMQIPSSLPVILPRRRLFPIQEQQGRDEEEKEEGEDDTAALSFPRMQCEDEVTEDDEEENLKMTLQAFQQDEVGFLFIDMYTFQYIFLLICSHVHDYLIS